MPALKLSVMILNFRYNPYFEPVLFSDRDPAHKPDKRHSPNHSYKVCSTQHAKLTLTWVGFLLDFIINVDYLY